MADITKCNLQDCPLKEMCYRFTVEPNEYWQAYSSFKPKEEDGKVKCDYFWSNEEFKYNYVTKKRVKDS